MPLEIHGEVIMKILNVNQCPSGGLVASTLESAKAFAFSLAESDRELLEPARIDWIDRSTANASPVLEGCSGPNGWHDYGITHGGRLEVNVGNDITFIFAESTPYDSYEHPGHGPYVNLHDTLGNELI
jgi:hypothetical protein